jgi:hypothetical protein
LKRSGWTSDSLDAAILAQRVFNVEVGGVRGYPAFYLDSRYIRQELEGATRQLGDLSREGNACSSRRPRSPFLRPFRTRQPHSLGRVLRARGPLRPRIRIRSFRIEPQPLAGPRRRRT